MVRRSQPQLFRSGKFARMGNPTMPLPAASSSQAPTSKSTPIPQAAATSLTENAERHRPGSKSWLGKWKAEK